MLLIYWFIFFLLLKVNKYKSWIGFDNSIGCFYDKIKALNFNSNNNSDNK